MVRVLLVDDMPAVLEEVLELMYSQHPQVEVVGTALNNDSALNLLKYTVVDVVSIDIHMGEYNGFDLCRTIHRTMPHVFITMCAADGSDQNRRVADSLGAHFFLEKPIGLEHIKQLIDAYHSWKGNHKLVPETLPTA